MAEITDINEYIRFGWWNTGLSPLAKNRATSAQFKIATNVILQLLIVENIDCLALGEVTKEDLEHFLINNPLNNMFAIYDGTFKNGRLQFDTGMIYRKDKFDFCHVKDLVLNYAHNKRLKIANYLMFSISGNEHVMHLFISHWPALSFDREMPAIRAKLAGQLNHYIENIQNETDGNAPIILVGDYNIEPFEEPLSDHLLATRDRTVVSKSICHFYNPFWRKLGENNDHSFNSITDRGHAGTYFHRHGGNTKWRTFDQIMVSKYYLNSSDWLLNESLTRIFYDDYFNNILNMKNNIFDHLPVILTIQRV